MKIYRVRVTASILGTGWHADPGGVTEAKSRAKVFGTRQDAQIAAEKEWAEFEIVSESASNVTQRDLESLPRKKQASEYLGARVTDDVKEAFHQLVADTGLSATAIITKLITDELKARGYLK